MMRVAMGLLALILLAGGCAWFQGDTTSSTTNPDSSVNNPDSKLIVTPETVPTGRVARVNESGRFVVLNFPAGSMPAVGQRLYVYRQGLRVGEIKVTGPQDLDNTVGDITTGEAQVGDEIRTK